MQDAIICMQGTKQRYYLLSPIHIIQRAIIGYDVLDTEPRLVNLDRMQRVLVQTKMQGEPKYRKGQYILQFMKKIQGNGCILSAHQFK